MKKFLMFSVLLFLSVFAFAQEAKNVASLSWNAPTARENGSALQASEIGGYEIKYRASGSLASAPFSTVIIKGAVKTDYDLELPTFGSYEIKVAVFDSAGLYSNFIPLTYTANSSKPLFKDLMIRQKFYDPAEKCTIEVNCQVVK
jgi:hypothetical protein